MAADWPDGWITATLKAADIPVTDFAKTGLQAWQKSTPMLPYTNNPLGMPSVEGKTSQLMRTGYAMFSTMGAFRSVFQEFLSTPAGSAVRDALAVSEKYSDLWRAVHALKWPANKTETDWPSAVLDLTSQSYRDSVASAATPSDRKTSGEFGSQTAFGSLGGNAVRSAAQTASSIQQATRAIQSMPGRLS